MRNGGEIDRNMELLAILVAVFAVVAIFGLTRVSNEADFLADMAELEQLRSDYAAMTPGERAYARINVLDWNMKIARNKQFRKQWWSWFLLPEQWEFVQPISIQAEERKPSIQNGL